MTPLVPPPTNGDARVLKANLNAFTRYAPRHAATVQASEPDLSLQPVTSRDGHRSFVLSDSSPAAGDSPVRSLHSAYAPTREADRLIHRTVPPEVAIVVQLGLGAAFPVRAVLERYSHISVIAVERSWQTIRTIFEWIDLSAAILSGRLRIVVNPEDLAGEIQDCYFPSLMEGARVLRLQSWTDRPQNRKHFETCAATARSTIGAVSSDLGPIRKFSQRWLVHTVHNTRLLSRPRTDKQREGTVLPASPLERVQRRCRGAETLVLAAGPGLDTILAENPEQFDLQAQPVIAVDTVVPALLRHGIEPAAVVTLDPQPWTVMHTRPPLPPDTVLCADLGVATGVPRDHQSGGIVWFIGLHPLHQLAYQSGAPLYPLKNPAQSVTEAAIQLAWSFGSQSVSVLGADGGYPRAQTYARGTYHYAIAGRGASRRTPEEQFFARQVYPATEVLSGSEVFSGSAPHERGPFFTTAAFIQRRNCIHDAARHPPQGPKSASPGETTFDFHRFWYDHCRELTTVIQNLGPFHGDLLPPITAIVQRLGPHGRAHLPVIARALQSRPEPATPGSLVSTIVETLETIRGYILNENNRY